MHNHQIHNPQAMVEVRAPSDPAALPTRVILEAIARRVCVAAIYNKTAVTLAPHIVYTRHGELYLDAVAVEREGRPPRELKIGSFKLAGLGQAITVARRFERFPGFDPGEARYADTTIFALDG